MALCHEKGSQGEAPQPFIERARGCAEPPFTKRSRAGVSVQAPVPIEELLQMVECEKTEGCRSSQQVLSCFQSTKATGQPQ